MMRAQACAGVMLLIMIGLLSSTTTRASQEESATGEQIKWQVIAGGGSSGSSSNYRLSNTVGQTAVGQGTSTEYRLNQGFWQDFGSGAPCNCGDADGNGIFTVSDAVYLISFIFAGGPAPDPMCLGDADGNGLVTVSDAVYLISYIFAGGPAPTC